MRKLLGVILIVLCFGPSVLFAQNQSEEDKFSMHGYMDILFLDANSDPLDRNIAFISMYRMNFMPQYVISPKLKATMLLEGADLFRLDEGSASGTKPGIVEWAYLTYTHNAQLNLKVGTFAIPFGIYNESFYASPTQLTSFLPNSLYFRHEYVETGGNNTSTFLFPRSPSGIMVFGKALNINNNYLTYNAYFANEAPGESLIGINKYLGGRLLFENANDKIKLGASYTSYLSASKLVNSTFGADIQLKIENFQLSSELIIADIGKNDTNGFPIEQQFHQSRGGYVQVGYTIKELVTPYFRYDIFDASKDANNFAKTIVVAGVNIAFHPQVIFKLEAYLTRFEDASLSNSNILISTLSIAF